MIRQPARDQDMNTFNFPSHGGEGRKYNMMDILLVALKQQEETVAFHRPIFLMISNGIRSQDKERRSQRHPLREVSRPMFRPSSLIFER